MVRTGNVLRTTRSADIAQALGAAHGSMGGATMTRIKCSATALIGAAILATSPGLAAWRIRHVPVSTTALRAIATASRGTIWVGGSEGLCFRSSDRGLTWQELCAAAMPGLDVRGIVPLDRLTAIVMAVQPTDGARAMLFRTSDAGKSWHKVFDDRTPGAFLDAVKFWDRRHGIAVGDPIGGQWYLLSTSDGGRTWQRLRPISIPFLATGEAFLAASNGALVVKGTSQVWIGSGGPTDSHVFRSSDRGLHWNISSVPHASGERVTIIGMTHLDGGKMVAVGGDYRNPTAGTANALFSDDDGATWTSGDTSLAPGVRESVGSPGGSTLLSVGTPGSATSDDLGRHWRALGIAGLHAISCRNGDCWASGNDGAVGHWVPDPTK